MKILFLGGTRFMGFFLTEELVNGGHDVTLLHRGNTAPNGVPGAHNVVGDRESTLDALADDYEIIIDTSGMLPRQVRLSTERFHEARYIYVSTVSVYRDPLAPSADETARRCEAGDAHAESVTVETYGALKTACEDVVLNALGDKALIVRPGLIVGPRDYSDRFTYWVRRMSIGGDVLAPGHPATAIQVIDARDLARWIALMVVAGKAGVYNAAGPQLRFDTFLQQCQRASDQPATLHWVSDEALNNAGVTGDELPLWIPEADAAGWSSVSSEKARQNGLSYRPIEATIADTLQWDRQRNSPLLKCGLTPERERDLLAERPG